MVDIDVINRPFWDHLVAQHLPEVGYTPPDASFLAWLDCRFLGEDPARTFLERGRVALSRGLDFGAQGAGYARLNFGTDPERLEEAVSRMAAALSR
jgi:cystathionine beta-lyase